MQPWSSAKRRLATKICDREWLLHRPAPIRLVRCNVGRALDDPTCNGGSSDTNYARWPSQSHTITLHGVRCDGLPCCRMLTASNRSRLCVPHNFSGALHRRPTEESSRFACSAREHCAPLSVVLSAEQPLVRRRCY